MPSFIRVIFASASVGLVQSSFDRSDDVASEPTTFDDAVRLVGRGLTGTAALTKARSLYPRLLAEYQAGDTAPVPSVEVAKAEAVVAFDRLVDRIATERGVPLTTAMVIFRPARRRQAGSGWVPFDVAPNKPSFITGLCSRCGPVGTGLRTRWG